MKKQKIFEKTGSKSFSNSQTTKIFIFQAIKLKKRIFIPRKWLTTVNSIPYFYGGITKNPSNREKNLDSATKMLTVVTKKSSAALPIFLQV